jgi:hypothetical protein
MLYTYHQQLLYSRRRNTYLERKKSNILENTRSDREGCDKRCMQNASESSFFVQPKERSLFGRL